MTLHPLTCEPDPYLPSTPASSHYGQCSIREPPGDLQVARRASKPSASRRCLHGSVDMGVKKNCTWGGFQTRVRASDTPKHPSPEEISCDQDGMWKTLRSLVRFVALSLFATLAAGRMIRPRWFKNGYGRLEGLKLRAPLCRSDLGRHCRIVGSYFTWRLSGRGERSTSEGREMGQGRWTILISASRGMRSAIVLQFLCPSVAAPSQRAFKSKRAGKRRSRAALKSAENNKSALEGEHCATH